MHLWHDLHPGENPADCVTALIEIPKGSRDKYELDKDTGLLKLDRVLYSSVYYPANYGFIPKTYCDDGDPLDILVLSQASIVPLTMVEARVIGVIRMLDEGEADDKLVAVAKRDMSWNHIHSLEDLPVHYQKELIAFFEDYKSLEGKSVAVEGIQDREKALEILEAALALYKAEIAPKVAKATVA